MEQESSREEERNSILTQERKDIQEQKESRSQNMLSLQATIQQTRQEMEDRSNEHSALLQEKETLSLDVGKRREEQEKLLACIAERRKEGEDLAVEMETTSTFCGELQAAYLSMEGLFCPLFTLHDQWISV